MDTIGASKLIHLMEVSFVEGSFNIINYQNGTRKVSLHSLVLKSYIRGTHYKRFHCIITIVVVVVVVVIVVVVIVVVIIVVVIVIVVVIIIVVVVVIFVVVVLGTSDSLAMVEDQCSTGNIILKRTGENIRYCKVADVESISQEVCSNHSD